MIKLMNHRAIKRHARPILAGLVVGLTLIWAQNVLASPLQPAQNLSVEGKTCSQAITQQERRHAIPQGLLQAIAHAESGRWDAQNGAIVAWPWTVTTGGKGHFLPNRIDAQAFVQALQADGVENIDVGCMQINLKYHPDAFSSITEAFNPHANAAYAASFLRERFAASGSWLQAAGDYHSTTEHLNAAYRQKISTLWKDTQAPPIQMAAATQQPPDPKLAQRFNNAFKARRAGGNISTTGQAITNRLNALKPGAHMGQAPQDSFARKRQAQMKAWRQDHGIALPSQAPT